MRTDKSNLMTNLNGGRIEMRRWMAIILVFVIISGTAGVFAEFSDVPVDAAYAQSVNRLAGLGIMSSNEDGTFKPDSMVTREEFAKMIAVAAGLEDTANTLKGTSMFPDVDGDRWSCGYINAAVNNNLMTGGTDGKFHPEDGVTFAQADTVLVRALGYADQDVPGLWPKNYIEKARVLGLTKDISLGAGSGLPKWAAAIMVDRLLVTNVKKASATAADKTYAASVGLFTECIILGNSKTNDKLTDKQVLTDKGIYYLPDKGANLQLGHRYEFVLNGDTIAKYYENVSPTLNMTVISAVDMQIKYKSGDGKYGSMILPDKTTYYYNGIKQTYDGLKGMLQAYSSVILVTNDDKTGYDYGVILDPVYSKPEVAWKFDPSKRKLGSIDFGSNPSIIRNTIDTSTTPPVNNLGEPIDITRIKNQDVVYQVSDVWGSNKYILVVDNKIDGTITNILPDKVSPKTIQINNKNYDLNKYMNVSKINSAPGAFKVKDGVTLLLGYDGKVVDVTNSIGGDTANYAFVMNYSSSTSKDIQDFKTTTYSVKLLFTDGTTDTCKVTNEFPGKYKGKLVKYTKIDDNTVSLEAVDYLNPVEYVQQPANTDPTAFGDQTKMVATYKQFNVNQVDDMLNSNYVADNIRIFDVVSDYTGADTQVKLIDWSSLPNGKIPDGKVLYMSTAGPFADVNVLVLDDIFDENYKLAVVENSNQKSATSNSYKLLAGAVEYSTSGRGDLDVGSVARLKISGGNVDSYTTLNPNVTASAIQVIDTNRIMVNNTVYRFNNKIAIYFKDSAGNISARGINDIVEGQQYTRISLYLDGNGKVEAIVVIE